MITNQLSIFVENQGGKLAEVTELLGENHINITAFSVADTKEFGILRLMVDKENEAVELPNEAGALSKILKALANEKVSIEYMYAFELGTNATVVIKVNDNDLAEKVLNIKKDEIGIIKS